MVFQLLHCHCSERCSHESRCWLPSSSSKTCMHDDGAGDADYVVGFDDDNDNGDGDDDGDADG